MKKLSIAFFIILAVYVTGCSTVHSKYIVGEPIQDDLSEKFDGLWEFDRDICYMKYTKNGELRIAGVEWKETNFKLEEMTVILTKCGEKNFVNLLDLEISEKKDSDYLFAYYSFISENSIAVWKPKVDAFEKAINNGEIRGEIIKEKHSTSINITEHKESLCNFIKTKDMGELFDLENPTIYNKRDKKVR